jgi:hypothetical protein
VGHINRDRDIRPWERFGYRVAGEYRHGRDRRSFAQVESDNLRTESPTNLQKKGAVAAADVQHAANRDRILTQKTQDHCRIAEPAMRTVQLPVSPCYRVFGQGRIIEKLSIETTA